jgi:hypothetical protein
MSYFTRELLRRRSSPRHLHLVHTPRSSCTAAPLGARSCPSSKRASTGAHRRRPRLAPADYQALATMRACSGARAAPDGRPRNGRDACGPCRAEPRRPADACTHVAQHPARPAAPALARARLDTVQVRERRGRAMRVELNRVLPQALERAQQRGKRGDACGRVQGRAAPAARLCAHERRRARRDL